MRQRNENRRPADRRELGNGAGARARDDEMRRRDPLRQIRKKSGDLGRDGEPGIGLAHPRQILFACLLRDEKTRAER